PDCIHLANQLTGAIPWFSLWRGRTGGSHSPSGAEAFVYRSAAVSCAVAIGRRRNVTDGKGAQMTRRRTWFAAMDATLEAILLLTLVATLASDLAGAQTPRRGGTLIVARQADITQWDPKFTNDTVSIQAQHQIYANLMQNSSDGRELRPSLAESYELSADSR